MRNVTLFALAILLPSCSQEASKSENPAVAAEAGLFAGQGRDRLCISNASDGWRVGIVTYGSGDNNCTLQGKITQAEHEMVVEALHDPACKLAVNSEGGTLTVQLPNPEACAYYCGPGATMAGRSFKSDPNASPAVDFAGDPLC